MDRAGTGIHNAVTWQPRRRRGCQRRAPWQHCDHNWATPHSGHGNCGAGAGIAPGKRPWGSFVSASSKEKKRKGEGKGKGKGRKKTYLLFMGMQGRVHLRTPLSSRVLQGKGEDDGRGRMSGTRGNDFQVQIRTCMALFHTRHNLSLCPDSAWMDFFWPSQAQ